MPEISQKKGQSIFFGPLYKVPKRDLSLGIGNPCFYNVSVRDADYYFSSLALEHYPLHLRQSRCTYVGITVS